MTIDEALDFIDQHVWSQCPIKKQGTTLWMSAPDTRGKTVRVSVRRKKKETMAQMIIRAVETLVAKNIAANYYEPRLMPTQKPKPVGDYLAEIIFTDAIG